MAEKSNFGRFRETRNFSDLLSLIEQLANAIDDEGNPETKRQLLHWMGGALERRYMLGHQVTDLEMAARALYEALEIADESSDEWADIATSISHLHATALREGGEGRRRLGGIGRTRSELFTKANIALARTPAESGHQAPRLFAMGHAHLAAFIDDWATSSSHIRDVLESKPARALEDLRAALEAGPDDTLTAWIHRDIADCLIGQARVGGTIFERNTARAIAEEFQRALGAAAKTEDWLLCLQLAQAEGEWFGHAGIWDSSADAYRTALRLAEVILEDQDEPLDREPWLSHMVGLGGRAAFAFARSSSLAEAVEALELMRGNWGYKERIPNIPLAMTSRLLQQATAAVAYLACSPWGSVVLFVAPDANANPVLSAHSSPELTDSFLDEFLGMNSGALGAGARPGERTPWELLGDFLADMAEMPESTAPPSLGARNSVLEVLHESFGVQPGTFLKGYLSVIGHESPDSESEGEMQDRFESTIDSALEVAGPLVAVLPQALKRARASTLILVPDGKLAMLPLHASIVGRDSSGTPVHLCDEVDCRLMNSAKLLAVLNMEHDPASQGAGLVVVANPQRDQPNWNLPWADTEATVITSLSPAGTTAEVAGREATLEKVLEFVKSHEAAHFACHGSLDPDYPWNTGLQLADSVLTGQAMLNIFQGYELVVMSACQTAISSIKRMPEELLGLPMSALLGGAATCVGALWTINDLSTAVFFAEFYRMRQQEHTAIPEALKQARNFLRSMTLSDLNTWLRNWGYALPEAVDVQGDRQRKPFSHPYYWAPFVQYGLGHVRIDWSPT